jgi:prepilin-type processing-associated H-X9-DG protein
MFAPKPVGYSYTLNATTAGAGMGLSFSGTGPTATPTYFKLNQIQRPSDKIMITEEPDCDAERPPGNSRTELEDGKWLAKAPTGTGWNGKTVTLRHSKKSGNANFADGHAQLFPWQWTSNVFYISSTNN